MLNQDLKIDERLKIWPPICLFMPADEA